jgi:hypothetical protein
MNIEIFNSKYIERFFPKDEKGYDKTAIAFYFGFHFLDGYKASYRKRAIHVCTDYWSLFGEHLKMMTKPGIWTWQSIPDGYRFENWESDLARGVFQKLKPNLSPPKTQREINLQAIEGSFPESLTLETWMNEFPSKDWVWQMTFHGGRIGKEASDYQIDGIGDSTETFDCSHLYLYAPVAYFFDNPSQHPLDLYVRWAQWLGAWHGTAGIGLVPATKTSVSGETSGVARAFVRQFPGVELAGSPGKQNALYGLLAPNWLNMINDDLVAKLGGIEGIRAKLADEPLGEEVGIHPYEGGVILSSGEHPMMLEAENFGVPPKTYGPVSRLLEPYRTTEPWGSWGCPEEENLDWLSRFDQA